MNVRETPRAPAGTVEWEFAQSAYASVLAEVPHVLFPYWADTAFHGFPGIARDAFFYAQAAEALMMFFDCAAAAGRPCALPLRAADSVWQAWMRLEPSGIGRFCLRHFGRILPHADAAHMGSGMEGALAACLVQARRRASRPAAGPALLRAGLVSAAELARPGADISSTGACAGRFAGLAAEPVQACAAVRARPL